MSSTIFSLFVVYLPKRQKSKALLKSTKNFYFRIKVNIAVTLLQVIKKPTSEANKIATDHVYAKKIFSRDVWYQIANNLNSKNVKDVLFELNSLKDRLLYLTYQDFIIGHELQELSFNMIEHFKQIEHELTNYPVPEYDSEKYLLRSLFTLFTGFSLLSNKNAPPDIFIEELNSCIRRF